MVTTILHELAHACTAYALGVRSTLFNYSVDLDSTLADVGARALIGVAGPLFCLALGVLAWFAFRGARDSPAGLPWLYFTVFGIGTFFGNSMSISFVGDFSAVAALLSVPMGMRYAITTIGAVSVAAIHFWAGRQLMREVPVGTSRVRGMVGVVVLPALLGMTAVIVANMPRADSVTRCAEAAFWVFAALGAWTAPRDSRGSRGHVAVHWADVAVLLLAVAIVRFLVGGIAFMPDAVR